jgi:beta-carotene hydroxylase
MNSLRHPIAQITSSVAPTETGYPLLLPQPKEAGSNLPEASTPLPPLHEVGRDLLETSALRRLWVLSRPILFLIAYVLVVIFGSPWAGIPLLLGLFVANICAAPDVVHNCFRLSKHSTHWLLSLYGIIVMQSGHSFRITHLSHHAMFPSKEDPEGDAATMTLWQSLLMGPTYVQKLWLWSMKRMRKNQTEQRWMIFEAILGVLLIVGAVAAIPYTLAPIIYVVVMTLGAWLYPLITAYFPHQHPGEDAVHQARSLHGNIIPWLTLGLGYHLEHHLYPRVPAHNMRKLSKRLLPYLKAQGASLFQVP